MISTPGHRASRRRQLVRCAPHLAATRLMVFAHTNRFRAEDPQYFSDTGGRRGLEPGNTSPQKGRLEVRTGLSPGGRWIRTFGPSVQTMLLDTADPLAGPAGRSLRETAPRWDFGYTFVAILMAIACAFFRACHEQELDCRGFGRTRSARSKQRGHTSSARQARSASPH